LLELIHEIIGEDRITIAVAIVAIMTAFLLLKIRRLRRANRQLVRRVKIETNRFVMSESSNRHLLPSVAIIIPMRNELKNAEACLMSLFQQDYPGDFEVMVCLPDIEDPTFGTISKYQKQGKISVVFSGVTSKPEQIHTAASLSKSELVAFLDADCCPAENWLKKMVKTLQQRNLDSLSGGLIVHKRDFFSAAQAYDFVLYMGLIIPSNYFWSGNTIMKNAIYKQIGGVTGARGISESWEWEKKLIKHGVQHGITLASEANVTLVPKTSFSSFVRQRTRWISIAFLRGIDGLLVMFFLYGIYLPFLLLCCISFIINSYLPLLILLFTGLYYLQDLLLIRKWSKYLSQPLPKKGMLPHIIVVLLQMISFYEALWLEISGKTRGWEKGKF